MSDLSDFVVKTVRQIEELSHVSVVLGRHVFTPLTDARIRKACELSADLHDKIAQYLSQPSSYQSIERACLAQVYRPDLWVLEDRCNRDYVTDFNVYAARILALLSQDQTVIFNKIHYKSACGLNLSQLKMLAARLCAVQEAKLDQPKVLKQTIDKAQGFLEQVEILRENHSKEVQALAKQFAIDLRQDGLEISAILALQLPMEQCLGEDLTETVLRLVRSSLPKL